MKKILLSIITACALLFSWGCSDFLDVNHDPNALENIPDAKVLLPAAEMGVANNMMGWDFGFAGAVWVEYWTQSYTASQFKSLCEYQPQNFGTAYGSLTTQALTDMKRIKTLSEESDNKGYYFIAEALSIFAWQIITDMWGDMPYSEALQGNEGLLHPKQDKGQEIYADLMARTDALLQLDLSGSSVDGSYDYIYGGDLPAWRRFVNSLKLKLMIRLSETPQYNNAATLSFIESNAMIAASARIPGSVWDDAMEGKRHPMREFQAGGANYISQNVIACKTFIDYLSVNSDPRLATLFSGGTRGAFLGDFDSKEDSDGNGTTDDKETYATASFAGNIDLVIMSTWEINFYIAEVYARANQPARAKEFYEAGVQASLAQHGISDNSILTGYAKWQDGGSVEDNIKQIAMQKWVAYCNYQHAEAFLERNRTKYPSVSEINIQSNRSYANANFPLGYLTISVNGRARLNETLPASPLYPQDYINRNINAPAQKTDLREKVWWNLKAGK